MIAFDGAFHGDTYGALSVGGNAVYRRPFEPLLPDVEDEPYPEASERLMVALRAAVCRSHAPEEAGDHIARLIRTVLVRGEPHQVQVVKVVKLAGGEPGA